jgi:hypothetical protein
MQSYPDPIWKAAFRQLMPQFVQFFFPYRYDEVDWAKSVEFLDKELNTILVKSKVKNRVADVLVKLQLKKGGHIWILLHIEVQGYFDIHFAKRMHQMSYRIEDLFGQNPAMLSIYTDDNPSFHPKEYVIETWGSIKKTQFNTYKVMDNPPPYTHILPNNPVAIIMEVIYEAIVSKKLDDNTTMRIFTSISERLFKKGYSNEDIYLVFTFIINHINFANPDNYLIFEQKFFEMGKYETTEDIMAAISPAVIKKQAEAIQRKVDKLKKEIAEDKIRLAEGKIRLAEREIRIAQSKAEIEVKSKEADAKVDKSIKVLLQQRIAADVIALSLDVPIEHVQSIQKTL